MVSRCTAAGFSVHLGTEDTYQVATVSNSGSPMFGQSDFEVLSQEVCILLSLLLPRQQCSVSSVQPELLCMYIGTEQ